MEATILSPTPVSTATVEPGRITDTLRAHFGGGVVELGHIAADLVWRVHRPLPRPPFEIRMHPDAALADDAQLRVWLETVDDHARDRAPLAPRFYHITGTGVRIRSGAVRPVG